jgi:hypothetical protein
MGVVERSRPENPPFFPNEWIAGRGSAAVIGRQGEFGDETRSGVNHPAGVWFDEPVKELSLRAEKYDLNYTLLHLSNDVQHVGLAERHVEDTYDRFGAGGR